MQPLWMNSPPGYPYAERIAKNDTEGILRFLLQISGDSQESQLIVRDATHEQRIQMLEDSGFTFDPVWRPASAVSPSEQRSALDDPAYRWGKGIGHSL